MCARVGVGRLGARCDLGVVESGDVRGGNGSGGDGGGSRCNIARLIREGAGVSDAAEGNKETAILWRRRVTCVPGRAERVDAHLLERVLARAPGGLKLRNYGCAHTLLWRRGLKYTFLTKKVVSSALAAAARSARGRWLQAFQWMYTTIELRARLVDGAAGMPLSICIQRRLLNDFAHLQRHAATFGGRRLGEQARDLRRLRLVRRVDGRLIEGLAFARHGGRNGLSPPFLSS